MKIAIIIPLIILTGLTSSANAFNRTVPTSVPNKENLNETLVKDLRTDVPLEKVINFNKTFKVTKLTALKITNSFGNITVLTWDKPEIKVDVEMTLGSSDQVTLNKMLDESKIDTAAIGDTISFQTQLYHNPGNNLKQKTLVNYVVYMPAANTLCLNNQFGDITLPNLSGKVLLMLKFGDIHAKELSNSDNNLSIEFTSDIKSTISGIAGGKIMLQHATVRAGLVKETEFDVRFSSLNIDSVVRDKKKSSIDKQYKPISIIASFSKINLNAQQLLDYSFDVKIDSGSFKFDKNIVKLQSTSLPLYETPDRISEQSYQGYVGKTVSKNNIIIKGSFTDIGFN